MATRTTQAFTNASRRQPLALPGPWSFVSWRSFLALGSVALIWLFREDIGLVRLKRNTERVRDKKSLRRNPAFCLDSDDPKEWMPKKCACSDPNDATPSGPNWREHHDRLVAAAGQPSQLDVVLIGDSITERWNGTRGMGTRGPFPKNRQIFEQFFDRAAGATLQGIALGSAGDTTNHLLWHLEHGLLPDTLRPKVFLLLIGTNNMGRDFCSKRTTLAGILHVLRVLQLARPQTPVLLHGLLPRNDRYEGEQAHNFSLGRLWHNIQWINGELQRSCQIHEHCHYMDATELFLRTNAATGEQEVNGELMSDALHPNVQGYREWAPLIVEQVQQFL